MLKSDPSTWTDPRHRAGVAAERLAAELLRREGYEVLEHRYRFHRHDVDLVARRGATVVFVEVKVRTGTAYGGAAQAITPRKRLELTRAASAWLQRHGRPEDGARFDVIAVDADRVEWLQSAFRPGWR
ncbi:MAG: YraN family protein [Gemmatimonadetes bacterium GWC2_71_9]|nr:MAG: YraN family protein [Gemmatimonadetes bacterium GWC2_71_9]